MTCFLEHASTGVLSSGVPFDVQGIGHSTGNIDCDGGLNLESRSLRDGLRQRVIEHLLDQGFEIDAEKRLVLRAKDKTHLRELHATAVGAAREQARGELAGKETVLVERLAHGREIEPDRIRPRLVQLGSRRDQDVLLWRWGALHWSIPVSGGYGRRLRFLVVDGGHNDAVIGLIGLGDPVFGLACRDKAVGWDHQQRREKLACVMDAFVLGAVPPYSGLCAGKLVALLATSTEVRQAFYERYGHRTTLITKRDPAAQLALVTTSSALGRSSVYNRLRREDGRLAYQPVGYTAGSGDFQFAGDIYRELSTFASSLVPNDADEVASKQRLYHRHPSWPGQTFRNRREVIQRALHGLGLDGRRLRVHGVGRQVFLAPLAENASPWLRGEASELRWWTRSADEVGAWWRRRWARSRASASSAWRDFEPEAWRLYEA